LRLGNRLRFDLDLSLECSWGGFSGLFVVVVSAEEFEEKFGGGFGPVGAGRLEFGGWGERAVCGVEGDFVDGLRGCGLGVGFGQIDAGGLEAVEKDSGAARVEGA
jgi:hypothetical protein